MDSKILVEQFCTPPFQEENDFDRTAYAGIKELDIEFENRILKGYSLGNGKNILLVHGWGSRASHMSFLAQYLANNGFHIMVFDGPAHGNSKRKGQKDLSSMFEFGRAVSCIAKKMDNLYCVIGHSLGAIATAFTMTGTGHLSGYRFTAEKLILISSPKNLYQVIENYSRNRDEMYKINELRQSLENAFNCKASEYNLCSELKFLNTDILIIHDEQDEDIPVSDALDLKQSNENIRLILTRGSGHKKILLNREMLRAVKNFLLK